MIFAHTDDLLEYSPHKWRNYRITRSGRRFWTAWSGESPSKKSSVAMSATTTAHIFVTMWLILRARRANRCASLSLRHEHNTTWGALWFLNSLHKIINCYIVIKTLARLQNVYCSDYTRCSHRKNLSDFDSKQKMDRSLFRGQTADKLDK